MVQPTNPCLGIAAELVEPAGFPTSDRHFRRAGMDYLDALALRRHTSFAAFGAWRAGQDPRPRLLLLTTGRDTDYRDLAFRSGDVVMGAANRPGRRRRCMRRRTPGWPCRCAPASAR